ncbi:MAG: hypothetical protein AAF865_14090 [Pseudomonadota bacterium]
MSETSLQSRAKSYAEPWIVVLALAAILGLNLQLWAHDTPPLVDWPNHLARHILQCAAVGASEIGRYYAYALELVPNLASELIHTLPLACADPGLTQKVLIQVSSVGVVLGTLLLHRAIWGRFSVWPLISALIMHHMAWAYGFENFVLAIPAALIVLAAWFALAGRRTALRLIALWPAILVLYLLHLYAFGFLLLTIGLLELERLRRLRDARETLLTGLLLLGLAAIPAWHTMSALAASPEIETTLFAYGGLPELLMTVLSPFAGFGNIIWSRTALIAAALCLAAFLAIIAGLKQTGHAIRIDPRIRAIAPFLITIALVAPYNFSGVYFSNIRFPVLVVATLIAATRIDLQHRASLSFAMAIIAALAVKTFWLSHQWRAHESEVREVREATSGLSPSDRLLVARADMAHTIILHSHSASYILRDQGTYWTGMFTGGNSLSPLPDYAARDHTQPFPLDWRVLRPQHTGLSLFDDGSYLHDWRSFYTHVLILFDPEKERPDASILGAPIARGSFFDLHQLSAE